MGKRFLLILFSFLLIGCSSNDTSKSQQLENSNVQALLERIGQLEEENKNLKQELSELENHQNEYDEDQVNQIAETENTIDDGTKSSDQGSNSELGINDEWIVDEMWKLNINSVTTTDDRNPYSEDNPAQVVIVDYSYENLGYEDDIQDLFITPENVVDQNGNVCEGYPADTQNSPKPTPVGAKTNNAQEAYGLISESNEIKIYFEEYDSNGNKYKVTFKVPVN